MFAILSVCILLTGTVQAQAKSASTPAVPAKTFATAEEAADALIDAAAKSDMDTLVQIFGSEGKDLMTTGEPAHDKEAVKIFVDLAQEKKEISVDPKNKNRAVLNIGKDDWPFAIPLVRKNGKWQFDVAAGRQELLYRRIGGNELDVIQICHGYVEAQQEYSLQKHDGSTVNQYAQQIIATPGKQDGLAWQNADGTWGGPIGEKAAKAVADGYAKSSPYHGYYFKVLKGQGPAAHLGQLDYVVKGAMIGGFALAAAPAEYADTGVMTFIVSDDGVVYQKDLGPNTLDEFNKMEVFNPDKTWSPVNEEK